MSKFKVNFFLILFVCLSVAGNIQADEQEEISSLIKGLCNGEITPEAIDKIGNTAASKIICNGGNTLLHVAVVQSSEVELIQMILDTGVNIQKKNSNGKTAIELISKDKNPWAFELLNDEIAAANQENVFAVRSVDEKAITNNPSVRSEGWYLGVGTGSSLKRKLNHTGVDTDVPVNCDQLLGNAPLSLNDPKCQPGLDSWESSTELDSRNLGGNFKLGYDFGDWRIEGEFLETSVHGSPEGGSFFLAKTSDKDTELVDIYDNIDSLKTKYFFLNVHYDIENPFDLSEKLDLSIGGGLGLSSSQARYSGRFVRTPNRDYISSIGRNPNAAGTTTATNNVLSDQGSNYQLSAGLDYWLSRKTSVNAKFSYVGSFTDFSHSKPWDMLRSHVSKVSQDGAPVVYTKGIKSESLSNPVFTVSLVHYFSGGDSKKRKNSKN